VQVVPFSLNDAGVSLVPSALKPAEAEAPAARVPFQETFLTVTCLPDWAKSPLQPCVIFWFPAKSHSSVQAVTGSPRLVTVRFALKPVFHELVA
jgi:hypothetical protein